MAREGGFTWIELMIILAVIAILGAIAVPGLHDTTLKKQVKEGMALADVAKKGVQASWSAGSELPKDNEAAGVPPRDKIVGALVKDVAIDQGAITLIYGNNASNSLHGMRLTLRPAVVKDQPAVPIAWLCHAADVPGGMEAKGKDETSIPEKWLPLECRGTPKK
ncbi:MAG TPA: pilin [Usitatibacter sp.]|nr:pilin [Usitatibacter sp.]